MPEYKAIAPSAVAPNAVPRVPSGRARLAMSDRVAALRDRPRGLTADALIRDPRRRMRAPNARRATANAHRDAARPGRRAALRCNGLGPLGQILVRRKPLSYRHVAQPNACKALSLFHRHPVLRRAPPAPARPPPAWNHPLAPALRHTVHQPRSADSGCAALVHQRLCASPRARHQHLARHSPPQQANRQHAESAHKSVHGNRATHRSNARSAASRR